MSELFASQPWRFGDRKAEAIAAEAFETPQWAAEAILDTELMTPRVLDPCCGHGTLAKVAIARGYFCDAYDLHDWGYGETGVDFLTGPARFNRPRELTVFMNPPFSKAVQFVERALSFEVRKIICFQRFAWWKSRVRAPFWRSNPPNPFTSAPHAPIAGASISLSKNARAARRPLTRGSSGSAAILPVPFSAAC